MHTMYSLAGILGYLSHTLHLFQVLGGVVGMNHVVLDRHIVASKDQNGIATGVIKIGNVVNDSVNAHFRRLEAVHGGMVGKRRCCSASTSASCKPPLFAAALVLRTAADFPLSWHNLSASGAMVFSLNSQEETCGHIEVVEGV